MNVRLISKAFVLAAAVALFAAGCVIRSGPGVSSTVPSGTSGVSSGAAIVIANQSDGNICIVKFSPSSQSTWGPDQLGATEQILPGQSRGWTVTPGTWDVRAEDCSGNELDNAMGVEVGDSPAVLTYGG